MFSFQDKPIRYEVSYTLNQGDPYDIIYQGLNHEIGFQLPAGNLDNDYKGKDNIYGQWI